MIIERRSTPMRTLSLAFSKSGISTSFLFCRAASRAASLTRLARSAPEKPGVPRDDDLAVEAPGAQQGRIQHVGPVGGRDENDALVGLEAVHLDQQLVQRL